MVPSQVSFHHRVARSVGALLVLVSLVAPRLSRADDQDDAESKATVSTVTSRWVSLAYKLDSGNTMRIYGTVQLTAEGKGCDLNKYKNLVIQFVDTDGDKEVARTTVAFATTGVELTGTATVDKTFVAKKSSKYEIWSDAQVDEGSRCELKYNQITVSAGALVPASESSATDDE